MLFSVSGPPSTPRINYLKFQVFLDLVSKQQSFGGTHGFVSWHHIAYLLFLPGET